MARLGPGDRVQVDVPDEDDPDHRHHGRRGTVVAVFDESADQFIGHASDPIICRVDLDGGREWDFFWHDLRPVPAEDDP